MNASQRIHFEHLTADHQSPDTAYDKFQIIPSTQEA